MLKINDLLNRCRRCGKSLVPGKLWCKECGDKIREELKGDVSRPLEYYFKYYNKHRGKE